MSEKSTGTGIKKNEQDTEIDRRNYLKLAGLAGTGLGTGLGASTLGAGFMTSARAAPTVLDDFEDGDIDEYTGHTSNYTVEQSSGLEGNYRLKCTDPYDQLASTSTHGRGYRYKYRFIAGSGSGSKPSLLTCVQDGSSPIDSCYWLDPDVPNDELKLILREGGSSTGLDSVAVSAGLSEATEYRGAIELRSDTVKGVLYDANGNQLAATNEVADTTYTGGHFGFYTGSSQPAYYDYVTKESFSSGSSSFDGLIIDDFEDGDLGEYSFENGHDSAATVVSSPTKHGENALELADAHYHLNSTSGLQNYPRAGDTVSGWIRGSDTIDNSLVLLYGVQDFENRYYAYVDIDSGTIRIRKKQNGDLTTLAEQTGLNLSTGNWYEVEVDWGTDGSHTLTVKNTSGDTIDRVSIPKDTQWTSGGIGYNAHTSNGASGYFDQVTVSQTRNLGSFDTSLDGWTATGSNSLSRVSGSQQPAAVTQGDHALEVTVNSDSEPSIENQKRVQHTDFQNHPCLLADVLPSSVQNSDSAVTFRFRYHHSDPGGVEESPEHTVGQQYGGRICWDMSGLSATKLGNPDRLEIVWYPQDHPPGSGFDYNGVTFVGNVRITDDRNQVTHARWMRKHRELERAHGPMIDQVIQSETDTTQDGVYRYYDGTDVSYRVEKLQNGNAEETCDGETFTWEVSL